VTWTKITDTFTDDPKLLGLSRDDRLLLIEATVYSNRVLSDGHIPTATVRIFTDHPEPWAGMGRLVAAKLLEEVVDGWEIVDFARNQRTRHQVEHTRETTRRRLDNWRKAKARNAVTNGVSHGVSNALPDPTRPERRGGEGMAAAAQARGDSPPLEKARRALEPFERFGTMDNYTNDDGEVAFEVSGLALIQAEMIDDGRIQDVYAWIDAGKLIDAPATLEAARAAAPHLEMILRQYAINSKGDLYAHFHGELSHRTAQIAAFLERYLDREVAA
jgi:hypothetical protein